MLCILNLHSAEYQLYLDKTGGEMKMLSFEGPQFTLYVQRKYPGVVELWVIYIFSL